jgi:ATP-dependent Clp endopeptidase proteolytic subunit ClpP
MPDRKPGYSIVAKGNRQCEVMLYDQVGALGVSARKFRNDLKAQGDVQEIHLHLNSPGGEVFDGLAIYNTLKDHPAKVVVHVDGMALSMASVIAMAGDEIEIADNAFLMIHNPMNLAMGDADEIRHMAELLDKVKTQLVNIYAQRSKKDAAAVSKLMDAETWLAGQEAVDQGFADRTSGNLAVAAMFDPTRFTNCPDKFRAMTNHVPKEPAMADTPKPATISELKAACPGATADFLLASIERGDTVAAAQTAWMKAQAELLAATQVELKAAKEKCKEEENDEEEEEEEEEEEKEEETPKKGGKKGKGKSKNHLAPGVAAGERVPNRKRTPPIEEPVDAFNQAVRDQMQTGKDRRASTRIVVRTQPALHQAYLEATNANKPKALELLAERTR